MLVVMLFSKSEFEIISKEGLMERLFTAVDEFEDVMMEETAELPTSTLGATDVGVGEEAREGADFEFRRLFDDFDFSLVFDLDFRIKGELGLEGAVSPHATASAEMPAKTYREFQIAVRTA